MTANRTDPRESGAWKLVAAAMFVVAWGGNEFTPLLVMYKLEYGLDKVTVDLLLFAYVLGIIPSLLLAAPLSDHHGRRPLMVPAVPISLLGSLLIAVGSSSPALLFVGRVLCGVALGLVMAVGGTWVKELSSPPFTERADVIAGARRAAMSLTAGFALGAVSAGVLAEWAPANDVIPYAVHILIGIPVALAVLRAPETGRPATAGRESAWRELRVPLALHPRFLLVIGIVAPWVFGAAGVAYAILPALLADSVPGAPIAFSALLCLVALGSGFGIQMAGKRLATPRGARGALTALGLVVVGMLLAALSADVRSIPLALVTASVLGLGYGMSLLSGLQEVQRLAGPSELAGLTAAFYCLAYMGFAFPALLAELSSHLSYPVMLGFGAGMAALGILVVALAGRRVTVDHAGEPSVRRG